MNSTARGKCASTTILVRVTTPACSTTCSAYSQLPLWQPRRKYALYVLGTHCTGLGRSDQLSWATLALSGWRQPVIVCKASNNDEECREHM